MFDFAKCRHNYASSILVAVHCHHSYRNVNSNSSDEIDALDLITFRKFGFTVWASERGNVLGSNFICPFCFCFVFFCFVVVVLFLFFWVCVFVVVVVCVFICLFVCVYVCVC